MGLYIFLVTVKTCPHCGQETGEPEESYSTNITHNLINMADAAGLYMCLWYPSDIGIYKASQLIPLLEKGIKDMEKNPEMFKEFNAPNGWGTYEQFLPWLKELLAACQEYPNSNVYLSR